MTERFKERQRLAEQFPALGNAHTVRCNEGFVVEYGARWLARIAKEAPGVGLRFVANAEKSADALREDRADLEIGVLGRSGPEIRLQTLLRDRFVGVVAAHHPLARRRAVQLQDYVRYSHISVSRRGLAEGPIDLALRAHGASRKVAAVVSSFPAALAIAGQSQMIANVPRLQTTFNRTGLHTFELPVRTEDVVVSMLWHPKADADPSHQWLRECIRQVCSKHAAR